MKKLALAVAAVVLALAPVSSAEAKDKPWHDQDGPTTSRIDWD